VGGKNKKSLNNAYAGRYKETHNGIVLSRKFTPDQKVCVAAEFQITAVTLTRFGSESKIPVRGNNMHII